jgi:filamentous hemagglutinin family protein
MLPPHRRPGPSTASLRGRPGGVSALAGLSLLAVLLPGTFSPLPARAQITPATGARSLGSLVNGQQNGCSSGACAITGGTPSGRNLFHRFAAFDTRNGISGVSIDTTGKANVIVGVTSAAGTFINRTVELLNGRANLFWLSPGGIQIGNGGGFVNASQLTLSTATGLRIATASGGIGRFDVFNTTAQDIGSPADPTMALGGDPVPGPAGLVTDRASLDQIGITNNGDLTLSGGLLTVDSSLLLDAQGGNVLLQGTSAIAIATPGGSARITGASATSTGSLTADGGPLSFETPLTHRGSQAVLGGSGDLLMNAAFTWADGATVGGTGTMITAAETVLAGTLPLRMDRSWTNRGRLLFTDSASLEFLRPLRWVNDLTGEIVLGGGASEPLPVVRGPSLLFNAGRIEKVGSSFQRLDILGLQNPGLLAVSDGSLFLNGTLTLQTGSITLANDATFAVRSEPLSNQGRITGTGTLAIGPSRTGTLENFGTIAPGGEGTAGTLTIAGNFRQQASGTLLVDLGGPAPGASDRLAITGKAELGGTLTSGLIGGYKPVAGDSIEVILAGAGISGTFSTQNLPPDFEVDSSGSIFRLISVAQPPQPEPPPSKPPVEEPPPSKPPVEELPRPEGPSFKSTKQERIRFILPGQINQTPPSLLPPEFSKPLDQLGDWESKQLTSLVNEDRSFSSSGEPPASGAAAGRGVGAATALSTQQTREGFLQGESQAQRDTAGRLGLSQSAGGPAPTPEQLQCLLREAADWVRSGRSPAQTRSEEDPCRS